MRRLVTLRLPAFRFLHLFFEDLIGRSSTEDRKAGPPLSFLWTEPVSRFT
jgi:hypothetical protein